MMTIWTELVHYFDPMNAGLRTNNRLTPGEMEEMHR